MPSRSQNLLGRDCEIKLAVGRSVGYGRCVKAMHQAKFSKFFNCVRFYENSNLMSSQIIKFSIGMDGEGPQICQGVMKNEVELKVARNWPMLLFNKNF